MAATTIAATKVPHTTTQGHLIRLREKQPGVTWVATARGTYGTPEAGTRTAYAPCEPPPRASCPVPPVHTARRCVQVRRPVRTSTEEAPGRTSQPIRGSLAPCPPRRPSNGASSAGWSFGLPRREGLACCRARGLAGVLLGLLSAGLLCCAGLTQLGIQPWVCVEAGVWWHKANQPPPFRKRTALDRGPAGAVDRGPLRPPG